MKYALMSIGFLAVPPLACNDSGCVEMTHPPVTDPAEPLVIGGTYGEALATVLGERSGPLRWLDSSSHVDGFPAPGETRITMTVRDPSMGRQIDLERSGRSNNQRHLCPDWLEAQLTIDLHSDDEQLASTIVAPVAFDSTETADVYTDITDQDLGPLTFDPIEEGAALRLRLSYTYGRPPEGALVLSTSSSEGNSGAGMTVELATWTLE